jgi:hypothetical protein
MMTYCVFFAVRTEFLIVQASFAFKVLILPIYLYLFFFLNYILIYTFYLLNLLALLISICLIVLYICICRLLMKILGCDRIKQRVLGKGDLRTTELLKGARVISEI